jgi:4-hydroxy-3-methylbut-2-enyl diphosphate reductase
MLTVDIDKNSGFCAGVIKAISTAEEFLQKTHDTGDEGRRLYSLGAIVHNDAELSRLVNQGLVTIDKEDLEEMVNAQGEYLLIRAHGEPPETYDTAKKNNLELIDATCPVVLKLQQRIKKKWLDTKEKECQIIIHGQAGHAEVLGLVGQTHGEAIVIEDPSQLDRISKEKDTYIYSQTTKSLEGYKRIVGAIKESLADGKECESFNTVCGQVANRMNGIGEFAESHELIFFVCGSKSSNGKILFNECKRMNPNSYQIEGPEDIDLKLRKVSTP